MISNYYSNYVKQKQSTRKNGHQWGKLFGMLKAIREEEQDALNAIWKTPAKFDRLTSNGR